MKLSKAYYWYTIGRDSMGLKFKVHRTYDAFHAPSFREAWKKCVQDNRPSSSTSSSNLPPYAKAAMEVFATLLIVVVGVRGKKPKPILATAIVLLLSMTASGSSSDDHETPYSGRLGKTICTNCGEEVSMADDVCPYCGVNFDED